MVEEEDVNSHQTDKGVDVQEKGTVERRDIDGCHHWILSGQKLIRGGLSRCVRDCDADFEVEVGERGGMEHDKRGSQAE